MPIYTYECETCHKVSTYYQVITAVPLTVCKACHGRLVKILSECSFILKGSGWAKDGYNKGSVHNDNEGKDNRG
jgi:putative FmdB family regulatory protein